MLALAFPTLLLSLVAAAFGSEAMVWFAVVGMVLVDSALLLVRAPTKRLFIGSAFVGALLVLGGLATLIRGAMISGVLATALYVALASAAVAVSAMGIRTQSRTGS